VYKLLRPALFRFDPENTHQRVLRLLAFATAGNTGRAILRQLFDFDDSRLEVETLGLRFRNPVGLAAGYDKDALAVPGLAALGFGHVEVGTVTCQPQPGNDRPRLFRVPEESALINSLGFPSAGAAAVAPKLQSARRAASGAVIGVNIGKGRDTPLEKAVEDYTGLIRLLAPLADYVTVNVSSPNTLGLRQLQHKSYLEPLLQELLRARDDTAPGLALLVKIAPDLSLAELDDVIEVVTACRVSGLIATNTLKSLPPRRPGGLSGPPLRRKATEMIRHIRKQTRGLLPIIGVGGIHDAESALEKLRAGASLVQIYTGLIYEGPSLVRRINEGIVKWMKARGVRKIEELVGIDVNGGIPSHYYTGETT
jgi:dihydroorotate dehydrogenase